MEFTITGDVILELLIAIIGTLVSVLYWRIHRDLTKVQRDLEELKGKVAEDEFPLFQRMDAEREVHWARWRQETDDDIKELRRKIGRLYRYVSQIGSSLQKALHAGLDRVRDLEKKE